MWQLDILTSLTLKDAFNAIEKLHKSSGSLSRSINGRVLHHNIDMSIKIAVKCVEMLLCFASFLFNLQNVFFIRAMN